MKNGFISLWGPLKEVSTWRFVLELRLLWLWPVSWSGDDFGDYDDEEEEEMMMVVVVAVAMGMEMGMAMGMMIVSPW